MFLMSKEIFMAFFLYDNPISNKLIVFDTSFVNSFFTMSAEVSNVKPSNGMSFNDTLCCWLR